MNPVIRSAEWTISPDIASLADVQGQLGGHLEQIGVVGTASFVIILVYEEIARNIVEHAATGADGGEVSIVVEHDVERVSIIIEDPFAPFDPTQAATHDIDAPLEERSTRGMGIHLVRDMADEVSYERVDGRNRLRASVLRS